MHEHARMRQHAADDGVGKIGADPPDLAKKSGEVLGILHPPMKGGYLGPVVPDPCA